MVKLEGIIAEVNFQSVGELSFSTPDDEFDNVEFLGRVIIVIDSDLGFLVVVFVAHPGIDAKGVVLFHRFLAIEAIHDGTGRDRLNFMSSQECQKTF